ncbi:MAG: B12-binding domain-containing radical SAM protein [Ignavibacteriae bacterium]|nr:B12-binding domain-containing radical SAM protein [Ignavibacteriota bacterium]
MKKTIIFYNPKAPYYTLPLQFLALASVIDRTKYDVKIIDARIEKDVRNAHDKVKELLPNAVCLGVSVITGTPIKDAVAVSKMAKQLAPHVPVVWGGWHPSIFPEQCIREGYADYCVFSQGEMTFSELLEALVDRSDIDKILGLSYLNHGVFYENPERKFIDINNFPPYDYGLIPLESYFQLKGLRQIDFYSSQGCPYRCAFCADPYVYSRRWSGLKASRMISDVVDVVTRYNIEDVVFQDENFFANRRRVIEFCNGINEQGLKFTWAATSRADQIAPLEDDLLDEIAQANLRKVIIGAESGSQEMLDYMKKDTLAEEAIISAEKLSRHRIGAAFNFIVGFPEEDFSETLKTLNTIKQIKRINSNFDFNIFFFTPYPGTELYDYIMQKGYRAPQTLSEWSDIDFIMYAGYWVKDHERKYVERFKFYTKLATETKYSLGLKRPIQHIAATRFKNDFYHLPIEKEIINFVRHKILHQVNW